MASGRFRSSATFLGLAAALGLAGTGAGCDGKEKDELNRKLNETSDKLLDCRKETNDLKNQVSGLKRQLANALANPGKITLTDPEIIELVASIRGTDNQAADTGGGPDPKAASKVVMQGAQALQQCYERALKKNAALQTQGGVKLNLGLTIEGSGSVQAVNVTPSVDSSMTECIKAAARRWKFPAFAGKAVDLEQSLLLTPKS